MKPEAGDLTVKPTVNANPPHPNQIEPLSPKALIIFASLPNELLENIFLFYVPQSITEVSRNLIRTTPTRLCLVCRRWCDIVHGCPELWSVLRLTRAQMQVSTQEWAMDLRGMSAGQKMDVVLGKVKQYIRRSKLGPLSVGIWTQGCTSGDISVIQPILQMFMGRGPDSDNDEVASGIPGRLKDLTISLQYGLSLPDDSTIDDRSVLPNLRTIDVSIDAVPYETQDLNFPSAKPSTSLARLQGCSPNLQTFIWRGFSSTLVHDLLANNKCCPIPATLTHIEIESCISREYTFSILVSFPLLKTCNLHGLWDITSTSDLLIYINERRAQIHLDHLENLALIGLFHPLHVLARLTAPKIRYLSLASLCTPQNLSALGLESTLSAFFKRSSADSTSTSLTHLNFENIHLSADEYERCLRMTPSLEVLDLYDSDPCPHRYGKPTHALLAALARTQNTSGTPSQSAISVLCPELQSLTVRGSILAPDGFLGRLVATRLDYFKSSLTKIHVEFTDGVHQNDQIIFGRLLKSAKARGQNIAINVSARL